MQVKHIPSLDGIRAFAVFIVLVAHSGLKEIVPGGLGVTVFFFLSGYLITTLLLDEYHSHNRINFKNFFIRRNFGLFPPLLVTLLISYLLVVAGILGGQISFNGLFSQIFYLANYYQVFEWGGGIPDGTSILWSLAIEEHFYLVFPMMFYLLINHHSPRNTAIAMLVICLMVLGWRLYLVNVEQVNIIRTYYATDTRIDSIMFGCIMAVALNPLQAMQDQTDFKTMKMSDYLWLIIAVILMLASFLVRNDAFRETYRYTLQGIALAPMFYLAIRYHQHPLFQILNWSWVKKLGVYSYFIYLIHHVVLHLLKQYQVSNSPLVLIILATATSVLYAFLLDRYVDPYFRALRKKFH